jgi:hypothetical protein
MAPGNDNDHFRKTSLSESDPDADLYRQDLPSPLNHMFAALAVDDQQGTTTDDGAATSTREESEDSCVDAPLQPESPVIKRNAEASVGDKM